jgi:hypothetical protein
MNTEKAEDFDEEFLSKQFLSDLAHLDDVNMLEDIDSKYDDFDFATPTKSQ